MRLQRAVVVTLLPLLAATPAAHRAKKETIGVRVTTATNRPLRFVVVDHGLGVNMTVADRPVFTGASTVVGDTLATPAYLAMVGVGEAEIVAIGAGELTATVETPYGGSTKAQTVVAQRVGIRHPNMGAPYEAYRVAK